ncbi:MAG: SHOCT domain-containing protein [Candidatus Limnocylindria bacterium]
MDATAWIWMFVWIFALVAMVWLIVRTDHRAPADDPEAILRARFARGEINAEEFERATLVLRQEAGSTR